MNPAWMLLIAGIGGAWIALALLIRWLERGSIRAPHDMLTAGAVVRLMQLLARFIHNLQTEGLDVALAAAAAARHRARPVMVVANHTAWIDPLLLQSVLPFEARWVMGTDMASPGLKRFWDYARVILVDRRVNESAPLREAIKHLKTGGAIGIFPEGFIERPPRVIYPFKEGVGLVVSRSGALVLPVVIDGTPQVEPGHKALWTPSRSRLRFLPALDYTGRRWHASEIAADLRRVFIEATGWPASDLTPRWEDGGWTDVDLEGRETRDSERVVVGEGA
ncbi:MAG: lysophospholipid acyltransferase family protein [Phycisphaerales bacterium]